MCTKNRDLVKIECLLLIFATVFLFSGSCQNAEPRRSFENGRMTSSEREAQDEPYDSATLDQRFDPSRWEGSREIGSSIDEENVAISSLTDSGSAEPKAETSTMPSKILDNENKGASKLEKSDEEVSTGKSILAADSTRCNSGRTKRRSCVNDSRLKKRRRYTSKNSESSTSNRIRGSTSRARRIQERVQTREKNRGRRRNGKRTRKHQNKSSSARSRKIEESIGSISEVAPAELRQAAKEGTRNNATDLQTKKFIPQSTLNETTIMATSKDEIDLRSIKNLQSENTIIPEITSKPEVGRKRHEDNVEHEFSKNLEKEIIWSRTELPDSLYENLDPEKINSTSGMKNEFPKSRLIDGSKNSRFDAAKMLGYSRSDEDLPIIDLENEVLARTLEDYNAYLKNGGKTSKTTRFENAREDAIISSRHPVYRHDIANDNGKSGKLQRSKEPEEPEVDGKSSYNEADGILKGDLTCINGTFVPAPLARHALIKYVKSSKPGHEYLEADYECTSGYYMTTSSSRLVCKNRRWIGVLPNCKVRRGQSISCRESSCDQVCNEVDGEAKCSCYKGFRLDDHKCIDIDECQRGNGGCEGNCINTPGSYRCECPPGMKQGDEKFTCIDVNECLLNNGHGPCQDTCRNHEGGYACSCDGLPGTILSPDNHTCQDAGPCAINNAHCSHTCLSTMGRVFCLCPDGYMLAEDWKTCQDIDECYVPDLQTEICQYGCVNTPGSYRCLDATELSDQPIRGNPPITCFSGYELTTDSNCVDINECATNNGGCSEVCENTNGSFFCACDGDEKALSSDGKSCNDINSLSCSPLDPAGRGYLMCSRETNPRMWRDDRRGANRPGTKCYLKCPPGYQLHGEYELTCQGDGTWDGPKHGECVKYSKPRLECPKDVIAEVPPDRDEAFVTFDQPSTDLDWFRYVRSKPSWGTRLEASLKPGLHLVTFFARHPVSKKQASCVLRIIVKDGEAPKVNNCPSDITGNNGTSFTWIEPTFTDNVMVTHTSNNESPGKYFGIGEWKIVYEASDEASWTSRCVFSVVVHQD